MKKLPGLTAIFLGACATSGGRTPAGLPGLDPTTPMFRNSETGQEETLIGTWKISCLAYKVMGEVVWESIMRSYFESGKMQSHTVRYKEEQCKGEELSTEFNEYRFEVAGKSRTNQPVRLDLRAVQTRAPYFTDGNRQPDAEKNAAALRRFKAAEEIQFDHSYGYIFEDNLLVQQSPNVEVTKRYRFHMTRFDESPHDMRPEGQEEETP